jgi:hypothetical protein
MKSLLLSCMVLCSLLIPVAGLQATAAAACSGSGAKEDVLHGIGETGSDCSTSGVNDTVSTAVEVLSVVAGIAGVIMVIAAGFRYITSGGDSGKVSTAKNALIYALVGLAIAALAQFLVHFVINTASGAQPCPTDSTIAASDKKCK